MTWGARVTLFSAALLWGGLIVVLSEAAFGAEPIVTESTNAVTTNGSMETTVKSPPPSAIAPQFSAGNGNELCSIGWSSAVQTQILGISGGGTYTEEGCVLRRTAKTLYDMGMKVAAVSVMCKDPVVWQSMMDAGSPCPIDGLIGSEAKAAWEIQSEKKPVEGEVDEETAEDKRLKALGIIGGVFGSLLFF